MTPTLEHFAESLRSSGDLETIWRFVSDDRPRLILDAVHESVGPLTLFDETEELTLEFGRCYHCHFDGCESDLPHNATNRQRLDAAAELAADYVARILAHRIGVAVHYRGSTCIGASLIFLDDAGIDATDLASSSVGLYGGNVRSERFLWSGPVPESPTQAGG
jgi:hypothetical protein